MASPPRQGRAIPGLYKASYALVIGNDGYTGGSRGWPKLGNAVSDAEKVKAALQHHGFEVTFLKDQRSNELREGMRQFFIRNGLNRDARLFIWFAGHGHTVDAEGYIVPVDAPDPDQDAEFRSKSVSMREVASWMREARSKHILAVFDSCFSGSIFRAARSAQAPSAAILQYAQNPIRQIITSGGAKQQVQDDGYFQELFVGAIMGREPNADQTKDGYVTGQELASFLRVRVTERSGHLQSPQFGELTDNDTQRGDFVFQVGTAAGGSQAQAVQAVYRPAGGERSTPRPVLPAFNANRIYIAPVMGAPGNGNEVLLNALRARLGKEGIEVWDADSDGAFKLQTVVSVRNTAMLVDEVVIQWRLLDKNRGPVATFQQASEVFVGSRNKDWASNGDAAADFAAKRLVKYLAAN